MEDDGFAPLIRYVPPLLDVTDKSLYSFIDRNGLEKLRESSNAMVLDRLFSLLDADTARVAMSKVPALVQVIESLQSETLIVVKQSRAMREKIASGEWFWKEFKDGSGIMPDIRDAQGWAQKVRLEEVSFRPNLVDSLVNVAQASSLAALTDKINQLSDAVDRIADGQHYDRIARYYSAKQLYIEAMGMADPERRQIALLNAAQSATEAAAILQQELCYESRNLEAIKKPKLSQRIIKNISEGFSALNDTVQISVYAYSALGEQQALLATVRGYQCFIEQTLLAVQTKGTYKGETIAAILYSSSQTSEYDWRKMPEEVVRTCESIIEVGHETRALFMKAPENQDTADHHDEGSSHEDV